MKTIAFGVCGLAIVVMSFVGLLQVVSVDTREVNLRDTLYGAMEASLDTALNTRAYVIGDEDELVADVVQGVALELGDPRTELTVQVNEVDATLGILSMKMTAKQPSVSGGTSIVEVERTVVLEHVDNAPLPGTHAVVFQGPGGSSFKRYALTEGSQKLPYPNHPAPAGQTFRGWVLEGTLYPADETGRTALRELPLDRDYTFVARVS